jgi:pilus assembly protein CpaB
MKITRVLVLGVALGAGVIAAVLALNLSRPQPAPEPTVVEVIRTDVTQVLVASKDIPMGTTVRDGSVEWKDWPKSGISDKFMTKESGADPTKLVGSIARAAFYAGEPILDAKLITSDRGFMSAILPEGKRAVATRIAADTSAGGFILPNDRVDVVMTRRSGDTTTTGGEKFATETILNNIRVLAIDQTIEDKGGEKVVVGQTATLELTPQQVEILSVAQQMSDRLTLSLRSIVDAKPSPSDAASDAVHLLGGTKQNGAVTVVKNGIARQETGLR